MAHDREVAGLRCMEVLAELSEYLDGELPRERADRIEAHVRGCDWCERFGGRFAGAVGLLRRGLVAEAAEETLEEGIARRLAERLERGEA